MTDSPKRNYPFSPPPGVSPPQPSRKAEKPPSPPSTSGGASGSPPPSSGSLPGLGTPPQSAYPFSGASRPSTPSGTTPPSPPSSPYPYSYSGGTPPPAPGGNPPDASQPRILEEAVHSRFTLQSVPWVVWMAVGAALLTVFILVAITVAHKATRKNSTARKPTSLESAVESQMNDAQDLMRMSQTWTQMQQIHVAHQMFIAQNGNAPDTLEDLFRAQGLPGVNLKDAWGMRFDYDPIEGRIISPGIDRAYGTDDDFEISEETQGQPPQALLDMQNQMMQNALSIPPR